MKKLKSLSLAIAAVLVFSVAAGCANSNKVVVATNAEFPPFEYVTENGLVGQYDGIDIAISTEIAKELGKELAVENMEFTAILSAISTGKCDFAAAGMTADDERRQSVDFSDTYFIATQYIIVRSDNTSITDSSGLNDCNTAVIQGYTGDKICSDTLALPSIERYMRAMDAVTALKQGKVEAMVIDSHTAKAIVVKNADLKVVEDPDVFEAEEYAIAVKKGNTALLNNINAVLKRMKEDGSMDSIVAHYAEEMEIQ